MSIHLDPREVLDELNQLGYKNISAGQLKEFMQDLKRLIRYENTDLREGSASGHKTTNFHKVPTPAATMTVELPQTGRTKGHENQISLTSNTNISHSTSGTITRVASISAASLAQAATERRQAARIPLQPPSQNTLPPQPEKPSAQASRRLALIRNTPTDLYQHYQRDWQRFQRQLPGETSRSAVRNAVRRMMETKPPPKPRVYVTLGEDQSKSIRRK